jgi:hypothetical protein
LDVVVIAWVLAVMPIVSNWMVRRIPAVYFPCDGNLASRDFVVVLVKLVNGTLLI